MLGRSRVLHGTNGDVSFFSASDSFLFFSGFGLLCSPPHLSLRAAATLVELEPTPARLGIQDRDEAYL
ncbi:hypothetical protein U9M48_038312 [Paspalum notatum var. saurae]|uniref:Uncharacterized protein n=1 Tax=Paspalum notatum var. saurae TaxID=547442 RepID=A0AAQ3XBI4_PASNO